MTEKNYSSIKKMLLLFILVSLFAYVAIRSNVLSFTHDECLSFDIIRGDVDRANTANNHLLNTWLMSQSYYYFGGEAFYLRLPNLLAFLVYLFFSYKILIKSTSIPLMVLGVSLLLFNPYLLDFFSLARGYGLSMGFGLAALYFLVKPIPVGFRQYITNIFMALGFALLAAYSNLICVNLVITAMAVYTVELFFLSREQRFTVQAKRWAVLGLACTMSILFMVKLIQHLFMLKEHNELYFGGPNNFYDDTLKSIIKSSLYFNEYGEGVSMIFRISCVVLFVIGIVYQFFNHKNVQLLKVSAALMLMILATIVQHYAFDALYPGVRTALIFLPLYALFCYFLVCAWYEQWSESKKTKISFGLFLLVALCLPIGWHFIKNVNVDYVNEWKYDSGTKEIMNMIREKYAHESNVAQTISISNSWVFEPSINYYRNLYAMDYLAPANREGINCNSNFVYCLKEERDTLSNINDYTVIKEEYAADALLLQRKAFMK